MLMLTFFSLELAEKLFSDENFEEAIIEYKRFIFFNPESESISYAYYKIGIAYRNMEKWSDAIESLKLSIQFAKSDSFQDEVKLALSIVLLAMGNYSLAELKLLELENFTLYSNIRKKAIFFRGIACLYSYKWKIAKEAFNLYFSDDTSSLKYIIDSILSQAEKTKYKSPKLAKMLSTILPGLGQIYVGNIRHGINAFIINLLTGYLLVINLLDKNYFGVWATYTSLFRRYYQGNKFHAERLAREYNEQINRKVLNSILNKLLEN
jgi:TM2 domain-containing membrane protein YozV